MKKIKVNELTPNSTVLLNGYLDLYRFVNGGVMFYKPGELSFPSAVHVHETEEVFIYLQGQGTLIINGNDYLVQAGDVAIVESGEEHHTRSSVEFPLVVAWLETHKPEGD